ncbi:MAG: mechanosensitive ion channel family protein [Planctomycetota bacterium]
MTATTQGPPVTDPSDAESEVAASNGLSVRDLSTDEALDTVFGTVSGIVESSLSHMPLIVAGLLVLLATFVIAFIVKRVTNQILRGAQLRGSLKELITRFATLAIWVTGILLTALIIFPGLTPSKALAGLGLGSVAIGLAFKDIFENFFAGVLILWRFPFENGDFIACDGVLGIVEDVTVRNTLIRTVEGELVVLPNAVIYKNAVEVLTNRPHRRISIIVGVAYSEQISRSRNVIGEAVRVCSSVAHDPKPQIFAQEFASSSVNFEVAWWTGSTPLERRQSRDEVVEAIKVALDTEGIEIPFPYRTLTFKDDLSLAGAPDDTAGQLGSETE